VQKFKVIDTFWKGKDFWVIGLGAGLGPIPLGLLPIKLIKFKGQFYGEIFRIDATLEESSGPN